MMDVPLGLTRSAKRQPFEAAQRHEHGFTIPELLVGAVLAAAAAGLIASAVYQFFVASKEGNDRLAALSDIQNATMWIGRDTSEAQSFTAGSGTVYGTLTTSDPTIEYRYSYDAANTALVREVLISGAPQVAQRIARHIANQADVSFNLSGTLLTISITATTEAATESATLLASMRVR